MKRPVVSAIVIAILVAGVYGIFKSRSTRNPPGPVKTAFHARFPHALNVNWEKKGDRYEAHWGGFKGKDSTASFAHDGSLTGIK